jgi:streptomycin 6-kinase
VIVPESLSWWRDVPGGASWLESLPDHVDACATAWSLEIGEALEGGNVALVLEATRTDGAPAVLKVSYPDDESEHEPDALAHWDGNGAVRLLERDDERRAILLERAEPGTKLWQIEDDEDATAIGAGVLHRVAV